jgi:hypothetical protein
MKSRRSATPAYGIFCSGLCRPEAPVSYSSLVKLKTVKVMVLMITHLTMLAENQYIAHEKLLMI